MTDIIMPTIVNLEQGTEQWKRWRMLGIGGSDLPSIMGVSPYTKKADLWKEKKTGVSTFAGNWATERGQRLEPIARELASAALGVALQPILFEDAHAGWKRVSLDGFAECDDQGFGLIERIGVELKCLGEKAHLSAVDDGRIPVHYLPQLAWQKHVGKLDRVFIGFFNPDVAQDKRFVMLEYECPAEYLRDVVDQATEFWTSLQSESDAPPDSCIMEPEAWGDLAAKYRAASAKATEAVKEADEIKKAMVELAAGRNIDFAGVSSNTFAVKGSIDWAAFQKAHPEMAAEIETFRKAETTQTRITIKKED